MKLTKLIGTLDEYEVVGPSEAEITGISYNSRRLQSGHLFAALPGQKAHGLQFLQDVTEKGATAVMTNEKIETALPLIHVPDARKALALLSNRFYEEPSKKLKLSGVTGTNGKTTVTFILRSIFETAGILCGLIGTIRYSGEQFSRRSAMTTPESVDLQELLVQFLEEGSGACCVEVSSQGLDQHRVSGCTFAVSIFTNLTQDHLDYHKTMEQYFQAKLMLFDGKYCDTKLAVLNTDDPFGQRILQLRQSKKLESVTYGFEKEADYKVTFSQSSLQGTDIVIRSHGEDQKLWTPLIGKYNVYNVTASYAAMDAIGIDRPAILKGIEMMTYVPGRLEKLNLGQPFNIIIDYAHTEDAFRQLLPTLRGYTSGRIIHIFGCRGERDQAKRPLMGKASGDLADLIVLTSDNPVNEDPARIAGDIKEGIDLSRNTNVDVVLNRADAIAHAVKLAKAGDTIVITGKGNETYQLIGDKKLDFDERHYFRKAYQSNDEA